MSPPAAIDRLPDTETPGPAKTSPVSSVAATRTSRVAHHLPHKATNAAMATPSPAATAHRSAADLISVGSTNAPATQAATLKDAAVTSPASHHLTPRLTMYPPLTRTAPNHPNDMIRVYGRHDQAARNLMSGGRISVIAAWPRGRGQQIGRASCRER